MHISVYDRLRTMVNETVDTYSNDRLDDYLDDPDDPDLHYAAAQIWLDKAGAIAHRAFNAQVDMSRADRRQIYQNMVRQAQLHLARSRVNFHPPLTVLWPKPEPEPRDNISVDA